LLIVIEVQRIKFEKSDVAVISAIF